MSLFYFQAFTAGAVTRAELENRRNHTGVQPANTIDKQENLNAGLLNGRTPGYYLDRANHTGSQPQRTIYPQDFCGFVAKDQDPGSVTYAVGLTLLAAYDVGVSAQLFLLRLNLPAQVIADCFARITIEFHDGTKVDIDNNTAGAVEKLMQELVTDLMGADGAAINNGNSIRKVSFQVQNDLGAPQAGDFGNFGIRALAVSKASGEAPL